MPNQISHAVVLAAGQGSRLRPLTEFAPKPLLPIDGVPVIDTVMDQLIATGCDSLTVITGYLEDALRAHIDARGLSASISYVHQGEQRGSAHALQCALNAGMQPTDSLVVAADTVWEHGDLARIRDRFAAGDCDIVMAVKRWPIAQLPHRSHITLTRDGMIATVLSRPSSDGLTGDTALSGSPAYAFSASFWERVAAVQPGSTAGMVELATALQALIDDGGTIVPVEVEHTRDLTRPGDLLRYNFPWLTDLIPAE